MYVFKAREATAAEEKQKNTALIIVIGVLGFLTFAFCVTTVAFYTKANAANKISGSNEGGEAELPGMEMSADLSSNEISMVSNQSEV